ncbi:PEP-utilizing enzyme [Streptomyces bobili]|uniref:PEP/pyruvate-binding domain-containing protein n=1 Tax=Streptomyces bobili TaxID=67280 RepID=UPI002254901E|nr:PEP/pyruvate-binding domain-containing protein [Streptomyces bobili]MCX5523393.1 PEP-utilizing enzyme [Streptomyces bobili]
MTTLDERHGEGARDGGGPVEARGPAVVPLGRSGAVPARLTGSKAANLARAARAGLPVLPGFVIPPGGDGDPAALRRAWEELSQGGVRPLVVRSSSSQEDTDESSQAGRFASVLDVRGWPDFRAAVGTVLDSAHLPDGSTAPMAVLVQPMLAARVGGVMFGADPMAGRADRMLVSAVRGGPDTLVSGEQSGTDYWLSRHGRLLRTESTEPIERTEHTEHTEPSALLTRTELARLTLLARRARKVFGGPQDIEFGFDSQGRLWLFQSRPITAMAARPDRAARLLGPGPVAETLPEQLAPLEEDLWVAPMARGLAAALDIGGTAPRRLLRTLPLVTTVGGRPAADLRLLGAVPPRHPWLALLNPAPGARRLGAAWRVGRLASALPELATDLAADIDRHLAGIRSPAGLTALELATELRWTRKVLMSLHAQESLAGALLREPPRSRTAAGAAIAALADARARGVPDAQVVATDPVVLALTAPSLRGDGRLPVPPERTGRSAMVLAPAPRRRSGAPGTAEGPRLDETVVITVPTAPSQAPREHDGPPPPPQAPDEHDGTPQAPHEHDGVPPLPHRPSLLALPTREALRLRIRWVQELQVRLAREAGRRLGLDAGRLGLLRWRELATVLDGGTLPIDLHARAARPASPPLPDVFRLARGGVPVAERGDGHGDRGRGASGGRAVGTVWGGRGPRPREPVLVVRTLDPALAPLLPGLAALVAETGSPLSHLAVLAREFGLPAVVGATDAVLRFPPGSRVMVDGTTGDVRDAPAAPEAPAAPDAPAGGAS